jgi:hypothetical protein
VGLQQVAVQSVHQALGGPILLKQRDAKLLADGAQQFGRRQGGMEDEGQVHMLGQLFQEGPADRGLARAHLPGEEHETTIFASAIDQMRQGLPMLITQEQVLGIGRDGKTGFLEAEIISVHGNRESGHRDAAWQDRGRSEAGG